MIGARGWGTIAVGAALLACGSDAPPEAPSPPPPVHVDAVRRLTRAPSAVGTSELAPQRQATLSAEAPGRVIELDMERGQSVEQGAVLLRLDVGRTAVATQAASAQVSQAEAALAQAQRERALAEQLHASGSAARRGVDQAADA